MADPTKVTLLFDIDVGEAQKGLKGLSSALEGLEEIEKSLVDLQKKLNISETEKALDSLAESMKEIGPAGKGVNITDAQQNVAGLASEMSGVVETLGEASAAISNALQSGLEGMTSLSEAISEQLEGVTEGPELPPLQLSVELSEGWMEEVHREFSGGENNFYDLQDTISSAYLLTVPVEASLQDLGGITEFVQGMETSIIDAISESDSFGSDISSAVQEAINNIPEESRPRVHVYTSLNMQSWGGFMTSLGNRAASLTPQVTLYVSANMEEAENAIEAFRRGPLLDLHNRINEIAEDRDVQFNMVTDIDADTIEGYLSAFRQGVKDIHVNIDQINKRFDYMGKHSLDSLKNGLSEISKTISNLKMVLDVDEALDNISELQDDIGEFYEHLGGQVDLRIQLSKGWQKDIEDSLKGRLENVSKNARITIDNIKLGIAEGKDKEGWRSKLQEDLTNKFKQLDTAITISGVKLPSGWETQVSGAIGELLGKVKELTGTIETITVPLDVNQEGVDVSNIQGVLDETTFYIKKILPVQATEWGEDFQKALDDDKSLKVTMWLPIYPKKDWERKFSDAISFKIPQEAKSNLKDSITTMMENITKELENNAIEVNVVAKKKALSTLKNQLQEEAFAGLSGKDIKEVISGGAPTAVPSSPKRPSPSGGSGGGGSGGGGGRPPSGSPIGPVAPAKPPVMSEKAVSTGGMDVDDLKSTLESLKNYGKGFQSVLEDIDFDKITAKMEEKFKKAEEKGDNVANGLMRIENTLKNVRELYGEESQKFIPEFSGIFDLLREKFGKEGISQNDFSEVKDTIKKALESQLLYSQKDVEDAKKKFSTLMKNLEGTSDTFASAWDKFRDYDVDLSEEEPVEFMKVLNELSTAIDDAMQGITSEALGKEVQQLLGNVQSVSGNLEAMALSIPEVHEKLSEASSESIHGVIAGLQKQLGLSDKLREGLQEFMKATDGGVSSVSKLNKAVSSLTNVLEESKEDEGALRGEREKIIKQLKVYQETQEDVNKIIKKENKKRRRDIKRQKEPALAAMKGFGKGLLKLGVAIAGITSAVALWQKALEAAARRERFQIETAGQAGLGGAAAVRAGLDATALRQYDEFIEKRRVEYGVTLDQARALTMLHVRRKRSIEDVKGLSDLSMKLGVALESVGTSAEVVTEFDTKVAHLNLSVDQTKEVYDSFMASLKEGRIEIDKMTPTFTDMVNRISELSGGDTERATEMLKNMSGMMAGMASIQLPVAEMNQLLLALSEPGRFHEVAGLAAFTGVTPDLIQKALAEGGDAAKEVLRGLIEGIGSISQDAVRDISAKLKEITGLSQDAFARLVTQTKKAKRETGSLDKMIENMATSMAMAAGNEGALEDMFKKGRDSIDRLLKSWGQMLDTLFEESFPLIKSTMSGLISYVRKNSDVLRSAFNGLANFLKLVVKTVAVIAENKWLLPLLGTAMGAGVGAMTGGPIGAIAGGIMGLTGGTVVGFGMAEGGIVTRPTRALIGEGGEPEAVIPLSRLGSMLPRTADVGKQSREYQKAMSSLAATLNSDESVLGGIKGILSSWYDDWTETTTKETIRATREDDFRNVKTPEQPDDVVLSTLTDNLKGYTEVSKAYMAQQKRSVDSFSAISGMLERYIEEMVALNSSVDSIQESVTFLYEAKAMELMGEFYNDQSSSRMKEQETIRSATKESIKQVREGGFSKWMNETAHTYKEMTRDREKSKEREVLLNSFKTNLIRSIKETETTSKLLLERLEESWSTQDSSSKRIQESVIREQNSATESWFRDAVNKINRESDKESQNMSNIQAASSNNKVARNLEKMIVDSKDIASSDFHKKLIQQLEAAENKNLEKERSVEQSKEKSTSNVPVPNVPPPPAGVPPVPQAGRPDKHRTDILSARESSWLQTTISATSEVGSSILSTRNTIDDILRVCENTLEFKQIKEGSVESSTDTSSDAVRSVVVEELRVYKAEAEKLRESINTLKKDTVQQQESNQQETMTELRRIREAAESLVRLVTQGMSQQQGRKYGERAQAQIERLPTEQELANMVFRKALSL